MSTQSDGPLPREKELADALMEGIVILDAERVIEWWNTAGQRFLGLRQEHEGQCIQEVLKGSGLRRLFLSPDEPITLTRKLGRKTSYLLVSVRTYRGTKQLLTIQDVTQLQKAERMRKDFVGNVSHELRTPLTVFRGYLELLIDQPEAVAGEEKTVLSQMSEQCHRMEALINGVLLLSRLEDDEPDISTHEVVAMDALLQDIVADAKRLSKGKHEFILDIDDTLLLRGQSMELRSLFSNLIYNAVRYTPKGGDITIRWYEVEGASYFSVADPGMGIAGKHMDNITQRFYRVDRSRQYQLGGGTGLGLAIVKHVLLRHGAELKIASTLGEGSVFTCVFPDILRKQEKG